jgi:L,D-peptidoglycan transpeptidase YkuD (ErfK/YbiS/YcfS/YnhG family)
MRPDDARDRKQDTPVKPVRPRADGPLMLRLPRQRAALAVAAGAVLLITLAPAALGASLRGPEPNTATTAPRATRPLPMRLTHLGTSSQVLVVRSKGWSTTHATLVAWQRGSDGTWHRVLAPVPARLGWNGFAWASRRVQSSGETPAGTFRLLRGFGIARPAGALLPYLVVDHNDWWPYDPRDPKTYNVLQTSRPEAAHWRRSWAEHLATYRTQYRFAVVLDYNLPSGVHQVGQQWVAGQPANTHKGGGIFLHVNGKGATAGCVSVPRQVMRTILQWLDPADSPRIVMGPDRALTRL